MPETVNLYLSDAQAAQVRALQERWGLATKQAAIREAIRLEADSQVPSLPSMNGYST